MQSLCPSSVLDADGLCCLSGMLDVSGACCPGSRAIVDKTGRCCATEEIDGCGICGGHGRFYDIMGVCCEVCQNLFAADGIV
jgi:hypothetical protein